ncbi:MAG: hypothetical protein ACT4PP_09700 [Sporichthyaceae bacterium]
MNRPVIVLPSLAAPVDQLWHVLLDLGELDIPWTLIGGQMVLLHGLEHSRIPPQISQDGDVIGDVRADPRALRSLVKALKTRGFDSEGISTDGRAHRYTRPAHPRPVVVDVLAPEGLGPRVSLTTSPPGRTIEVPAGTQLLSRSELVEVRHSTRTGSIPRPSLLAAVVGKSAACKLPGDPARHLRDLAFLCALVGDPFAMRQQMTSKDLSRLRGAAPMLVDRRSLPWLQLGDDLRARGADALEILAAR